MAQTFSSLLTTSFIIFSETCSFSSRVARFSAASALATDFSAATKFLLEVSIDFFTNCSFTAFCFAMATAMSAAAAPEVFCSWFWLNLRTTAAYWASASFIPCSLLLHAASNLADNFLADAIFLCNLRVIALLCCFTALALSPLSLFWAMAMSAASSPLIAASSLCVTD